MALNLVRNSRVFFTTNVDALTGAVLGTGYSDTNTFEIQVLDGFTFSQGTNNETVTIVEGGATPTRGQRAFNTSLAPADFSFSTYIRPSYSNSAVQAEESVLWNALSGSANIGSAGAGWTAGTPATVTFANSDKHQLQKFGLIFLVDKVAYVVDNCSLNQAVIDFGLDAIATVAWTGQGTTLRQVSNDLVADASGNFTGSGIVGAGVGPDFKVKNTSANYITNKLSTVTLSLVKDLKKADGSTAATAGSTYNLALTGGSITITNNINYLTPANLGTVNLPIGYYTGARSITGTINAYLRTGNTETGTGKLLDDMLDSAMVTIEPMFALSISIGGNNTVKVMLDMPTTVLTVPTVDVQQVISTAINFTAQGATDSTYDLTNPNELSVKYYAPVV